MIAGFRRHIHCGSPAAEAITSMARMFATGFGGGAWVPPCYARSMDRRCVMAGCLGALLLRDLPLGGCVVRTTPLSVDDDTESDSAGDSDSGDTG